MRRLLQNYCYFAVILFAPLTFAAKYSLKWEPPTEKTDGTVLPPENIANYQVFWTDIDGSSFDSNVLTEGPVDGITLDLPGFGCRTFGVQTVDINGTNSEMSNTVEHCVEEVLLAPPSQPQAIVITWKESEVAVPFFVSDTVTQPTVLANRIPFSQSEGRYTLRFTLNTLGTEHGLVSKDEKNQGDVGHTSLWVNSAGELILRHQGPQGTTIPVIKGGAVQAQQQHIAELAWKEGVFMSLSLDGQEIGRLIGTQVYGMSHTTMDTVLGGTCISCVIGTTVPTTLPIRGQVQLTVWDQ